jgi:hypothetical protein
MDDRPQLAPAAVEDRGVNAEHRLVGRDLQEVRQVRWANRRQGRGIGQPSVTSVPAEAVLDHAACNIGHQSAIAAAAASHRIRTGSFQGSPAGLGRKSELEAAKRRIAALEAELGEHRRASELLGKVVPQKAGSRPWR